MKHLWVHACDEHARVCAGVLCVVLCWLFLFSGRGSECGRVTAQRTTRQTPLCYLPQTETLAVVGAKVRGRDRTLLRPKPPPETLARGGPEAPLAPPLY